MCKLYSITLCYKPIGRESLLRSSRPEVFCKKVVLRNFAKFTGKHLCQSLFFIKVAGFRQLLLSKLSQPIGLQQRVIEYDLDTQFYIFTKLILEHFYDTAKVMTKAADVQRCPIKNYLEKLSKIQRKISVPEPLFNKVTWNQCILQCSLLYQNPSAFCTNPLTKRRKSVSLKGSQ